MTDFERDIDETFGIEPMANEDKIGYATVDTHEANGNRVGLTLKLDCHCTDLGNAKRFVAMHAKNVRYCKQTGQWYIWDSLRWAADRTEGIMQLARQVAEHIDIEADYVQDADFKERIRKKEEIIKWAKTSENEHKLRAMLSLAESFPEIAFTADAFDKDRMLLNCLNGTLDLELFELRPHRREDYITKLAPVNYEPDATFTYWDSFLEKVLPHHEVRDYLQRVTGYSLTGKTDEEKLFYICGPTASGKSTYIEAIKATFGDYADTADFDAFLKRKFVGGPRNDIARLDGARFVSSIEVDEGKSLAEALIKNLTGNEKIVARFLHKEFFVFHPQFKLFFAANTMPRINAKDSAVWRRIDVIPFNVTIEEEERDPKIKEILRNPELAGQAILAWAVNGCREWIDAGLQTPDAVRATTQEYRLLMSELKPFIEDKCKIGPQEWEQSSVLYDGYEIWCDKRKFVPLDMRQFTQRLADYGCRPKSKRVEGHKQPVRGWLGIRLLFDSGSKRDSESIEDEEDVGGLQKFA